MQRGRGSDKKMQSSQHRYVGIVITSYQSKSGSLWDVHVKLGRRKAIVDGRKEQDLAVVVQ